jgi:hypothetical protein
LRKVTSLSESSSISIAVYPFDGPNMYPELCCSGAYDAPSIAVSVSGGSGATSQQMRDMSGTYVTQPYPQTSPYQLFDTRWSFDVDGFRYQDQKFQSELPSVGSPFASYVAYAGNRRALTFSDRVKDWYYADGTWREVLPGSPPYIQTTTATACGFLGNGTVVNVPGVECALETPFASSGPAYGREETTALTVYITRRVATRQNLPNWWTVISSNLGSYMEDLKVVDRSDTRTVARVHVSLNYSGQCGLGFQFAPSQVITFIWQGDVQNTDECSLTCDIPSLEYLGYFVSVGSSTFSWFSANSWSLGKINNLTSIPTVSVATV